MKIPLRNGREEDALEGRKYLKFKPGQRKEARRAYCKRMRKWLKLELLREVEELDND